MAAADQTQPPEIEYVTVTRVIEYNGPAAWITQTLAKGNVPASGVREFPHGGSIKSGLVSWSGAGSREPDRPAAEQQQEEPRVKVPIPIGAPPGRGGR